MNNHTKIKINALILITGVLFTGLYMNLFHNFMNTDINSENDLNVKENDKNQILFENPKQSIYGEAQWWNSSFLYRKLINITNPYAEDLVNQIANITFNYTKLVSEAKMQDDLEDIRIVENGVLCNYYFRKDFLTGDLATVWFEVDLVASTTEYDTYLYYGNDTVDIAHSYFIDEDFGVAWYRFEENGGITIEDSSGNNNDGTIGDNPQWSAPKIENYSLEFDGSDYVQIPDSPSLSPSEEISISFWVYLTGNSQTAIRKNNRDYLFEFGTNGGNTAGTNPQFYVRTSTGAHYIYGSGAYATLQQSQWYHCVGTYNYQTGSKMYINGQQATITVGSSSLGTIYDENSYLRLGNWAGEVFRGRMDDVRIFDHVLTSDELARIYSQSKIVQTKLNEEQIRKSSLKVTALDLYDNIIPDVNISVYDFSIQSEALQSRISGSDGSVNFYDLDFGSYNFTVYMEATGKPGYKELINKTSTAILVDGIVSEKTLICNVSRNIFYVKDCNNDPVESGYILMGNSTPGFGIIQNCSIDNTGTAIFRWIENSPYSYNYTIKYRNDLYFPNELTLAKGDVDNPNTPYTVFTNLTTINFILKDANDPINIISGAKLNLTNVNTRENVVNLTTDDNGRATLRWLNSTGLKSDYELRIYFWFDIQFNATGAGPTEFVMIFTAENKFEYDLRCLVDPDDFQTELIWLNPEDTINIDWGTQLTLRALLNVTLAGGPPPLVPLEPTYADTMIYKVKFGQTIVLSGTMPMEDDYQGRHKGTIDTALLEANTYIIEISAQKSGFTTPDDLQISLNLLKNEVYINYTEDSVQSIYWLEPATISVMPYGVNSESFIIEEILFKQEIGNDYDIKFSVPDLKTNWNLTKIIFNIDNVQFGVDKSDIELNITDPYGTKWIWNNTSINNYEYYSADATNGTWRNLIIEPPIDFFNSSNSFGFFIEGNFVGTVDVSAIATFTRNKIQVEYIKFNVSDSISILSDDNGWAMQNVTFEISNCRTTLDWSLVDPSSVISRITTNEGINYTITDINPGQGTLTISNITIYALDNQFLFTIYNNTNISFDVFIKVEYIQEFYWNSHFEINNGTTSKQISSGEIIEIGFNGYEWTDTGVSFIITELKNATDNEYISISEAGLYITIGTNSYYFDDFGTIYITNINKDTLLAATIYADLKVTFDLEYLIGNSRQTFHELMGTINYQIVEAPSVYGSAQFNQSTEYYDTTIDTSLLNARGYNVRFTLSKANYDSGTEDVELNVLKRLTLINGQSGFYSFTSNIYVKDAVNFTFSYLDQRRGTNITDLDIKIFEWKLGSQTGQGELIPYKNEFILDFDTELRNIGAYTIVVTLEKNNYESRVAIISLIISERTIDYDLGSIFEDKIARVVKGKKITLSIELTDPTKGDNPLTGAKVVLEIGDDKLKFDEVEDGVYELEFDTEDYEAFFTSNTITGTIKISKADYESEEVDITIVVEMEEIVEGVPVFYFIMIVGAIAAVVGSLATYRLIQIARIPKFVKKARAMKKAIKGKKEIPESSLTKSKEELIFNEFGDEWEEIGLSLKYVLGINGKKGKSIDGSDKLSKNKGGAE